MNNPYNIYLHDTPSKSLFTRSDRALSSGCVRMAEAEKVVDFVLAYNQDWSETRKQQLLAEGDLTEISAAEPLPVYLLYQTVWFGPEGNLVYGHDMYGWDAELQQTLRGAGYWPPV
jgi:murein L,D-transpeptidase YcbB/YkuD